MGYILNTIPTLHNVEVGDKELLLCQHSQKLAIMLRLIKTPPKIVMRVVKNLKVCNDYHIETKFISNIITRDIVVRMLKWIVGMMSKE